MKMKVKPSLAFTGLILGGGCVALLVVELGLRVSSVDDAVRGIRVASHTEPHPQFGWFNVPGASFVYRTEHVDFGTPVRFNTKGLREREYTYAKRKDVFRVLILGDSFTPSLEVPFEYVWHELLEHRLNEARGTGPEVEVIGAGVQGWGTDQELLFYRHEGYRYEPNLVILQFYWDDVRSNDIELLAFRNPNYRLLKPFFVLVGDRLELRNFPYRHVEPAEAQRSAKPLAEVRRTLRQHSAAYRFLRSLVIARRQGRVTPFCYRSSDVPVELYIYAPDDVPEYARAWELTGRLIETLANEVVGRGGRLALLYFPDRRQVLPQAWEDTLQCWPKVRAMRWDLDKPNRTLAKISQRLGVPYLDLTPSLREYVRQTGNSSFFDLDGHFNRVGHVQVAEVVRSWVVGNGGLGR